MPAPSSVFTPVPALERTTASVPTSEISPITSSAPARRELGRSPPVFSGSSALEQPSPHTGNDVATQSQTIPPIDKQPLNPDTDFGQKRQSPLNNVTEILDVEARNHRRTLPANTSKMQVRPNTSTHRKSEPLLMSYLPDIVTKNNSPFKKTQKQISTKFNRTNPQKQKTHHQKK